MDVKTEKAQMVAALLAVLWALGAPAAVEASLPLDAPSSRVFKTVDPFAAAPEMDLPSLTQQLRAMEERKIAASDCVALCELAAGIEAHPFGRAVPVPPNRSEDAWGNYRFTSELETSHNRFGFTGHYWDKEASLYYAKARYYDPFTARFTQSDSFLGKIDDPPSLHRYFYANANPTHYVDLSGHAGSDNQAKHFGTYRGGPSNSAKAFAGVFYGVGQTIEAGGQLTYDFTGTILYGRGEVLHEETAKRFFGMVDHAHEVGLFNSVIEGLTQPFKNFQSAMDRGDAFGAATAVGNVTGQALTVGEGVANLPKVTLAVSGPSLAPELAYATESVATASSVLPKAGIRFGGGSGNLAGLSGISLMSEASQGSRGDANADSGGSSGQPLGEAPGSADLRPYGGPGGGHHVPAKGAFTGAKCYDCNTALAVPNSELAQLNVSHSAVTGAQASAYRSFAKTGQTLTWEAIERIETQALVRGGMKPEVAGATVKKAIEALQDAGVPGPTRIPWGGK